MSEGAERPQKSEFIEMSETDFNKIVTQDRKRSMNQKIDSIDQRIKHLKKVKRRWQLADNVIKIIGITFTAILTLITTIINTLPNNTIEANTLKILTAILSSLAAITALSSEGAILGFTGKNKSKYIKLIKQLETKLNKVYIYYEKTRSDAIISNEELAEFFKLLSDEELKFSV